MALKFQNIAMQNLYLSLRGYGLEISNLCWDGVENWEPVLTLKVMALTVLTWFWKFRTHAYSYYRPWIFKWCVDTVSEPVFFLLIDACYFDMPVKIEKYFPILFVGSCIMAALLEHRKCLAIEKDPTLFINSKVRTVSFGNTIAAPGKRQQHLERSLRWQLERSSRQLLLEWRQHLLENPLTLHETCCFCKIMFKD